MGNQTNMENWAARERLRLIECAVWWRGWVRRADLMDLFGVSAAQASSDLKKYQELNPGGLVYAMSRKRYEGAEAMACVLHEPQLAEAMACFLDDAGAQTGPLHQGASDRVARVRAPLRRVEPLVERWLFQALSEGLQVEIRYLSVNSGSSKWRRILPKAFGHDGLRWHVRAWCLESLGWRDFVLGRVMDIRVPVAAEEEAPRDETWEKRVRLKLRVNPDLSPAARAALCHDYGTDADGGLEIECREAMVQYVEASLRVPPSGEALPAHFINEGVE